MREAGPEGEFEKRDVVNFVLVDNAQGIVFPFPSKLRNSLLKLLCRWLVFAERGLNDNLVLGNGVLHGEDKPVAHDHPAAFEHVKSPFTVLGLKRCFSSEGNYRFRDLLEIHFGGVDEIRVVVVTAIRLGREAVGRIDGGRAPAGAPSITMRITGLSRIIHAPLPLPMLYAAAPGVIDLS